ncbi:MFS transporter [Komagataeibacter oboediens]|nr:MFS transporter [Komagataeibacter oboediens]
MKQSVHNSSVVPGYRFVIYAMTVLMCVIGYGDRAVLAAGMPLIGQEFGLSTTQVGWVLSSFLWSYFILNLPAALLLDRFGPRVVGMFSVVLWSVAMILGALSGTLVQFLIARVLLGAGEAATFSLGNKVVDAWSPVQERSIMMTAFTCGIQIGLAAGAAVGAWLIMQYGWRVAFVVLGVVGCLWAAAWFVAYPAHDRSSTLAGGVSGGMGLSLRPLLRSRSFWCVVGAQCTGNYANFLMMTWVPTYLVSTLHMDLLHSGANTAICYLAAACLSMAGSRAGEWVLARSGNGIGARRRVVAFFLSLVMVVAALPLCTTALEIMGVLSLAMGAIIAALGTNMALLAELLVERHYLGSVTGFMLTFSNGIGILAPVATGYLVAATGNFHAVFYVTACIVLAGALTAWLGPRQMFHAAAGRDRAGNEVQQGAGS